MIIYKIKKDNFIELYISQKSYFYFNFIENNMNDNEKI